MRICYAFLFTALLFGCGTQQTKETTDYEKDLLYPRETASLVFKDIKVYDEPLYGAALTYLDPSYPTDVITLYIYPIPATEWDDQTKTLIAEMDKVIAEVNYAIQLGKYSKVGEETRTDFSFEHDGKQYSGLKSSFNTWLQDDTQLDSFAYLFISEDKFIKFRTSFHALLTPDWSGDHIVQEILPQLMVPPESAHMKKLRAEHRKAQQQRQQELLKLILQAVEDGSLEVEQKDKKESNN